MNKIKIILSALAVSVLTVLGTTFFQPSAYADSSVDYRLGITPTQKGFGTINPGETYSDKFKVKNTGRETFDFTISFSTYNVEGQEYTANYEKATQYNDIVKWLSVDIDSGTVAPGDEVEITSSFTVPEDAHGGAQLGTIMVSMGNDSSNTSGGLEAVRRLGYIVYGNVNGEVTTTAKILENKIPSFIFTPPIAATSVVENTGNIYTSASYSLQVFPLFSDEEIYTNEEDPDKNIIFPETQRFYTASWDGAPHLGIFRVRQTVKIFDEVSTVEKLVFLCPIWFLFIILLVIFVAIFWIVSRIRGRNKE